MKQKMFGAVNWADIKHKSNNVVKVCTIRVTLTTENNLKTGIEPISSL